jgi:L-alanine-DL-glutamate epimerase-like enolase superfamily enzyme
VKVTDIKLTRLRVPLDPPFFAAWDPNPRTEFTATLVTVETDAGIVGYGSGDTMDGFEAFRHLFIDTDPMQILDQVKRIETINFHGGRYWPLEAAFWDIIGKVANLPVATLFGGSKTKLAAYASFGELRKPKDRAKAAEAAHAKGFQACKIRISRDRLAEGIESVRETRQALGPDFGIAVDMNQMWRMSGDIENALPLNKVRAVAEQLHELGVMWIEEPLPQFDIEGIKTIRAEVGVAISGGEMVRSMPELADLLFANTFDIYQPDVVLAVGLYRARQVAEMAALKHRLFTPHSWTNGLGVLANLHVSAGVGGGPYFEFPYDPPGWTIERRDFFIKPIDIDSQGFVHIPNAPGIGVELDHDAIKRFTI